jgi:hypothetical protein
MKSTPTTIVLIVLCVCTTALAQIPQTVSYQGVLTDGAGTPVADGTYNITFNFYDATSGGSALWTETQAVAVTGGIFSAILGSTAPLALAFDRPYWLGVSVDGGAELSPRRELTASPYSLNARGVADSAITGGMIKDGTAVRSLSGLTDDVTLAAGENVTITQSNDSLIVSAAAGTTATTAWSINGNAGTESTINFLGTTDTEGLTFRVNNEQALYIANNSTCPIIVGGHAQNDATAATGAVIAGGGQAGSPNHVMGDFGVIGGGVQNTAEDNYAVVGGGRSNYSWGEYSAISGGFDNETDADYATVGGGSSNTAEGLCSTVPGGYLNTANGHFSFAAGRWAVASQYGCFVWSDSTNAVFQSTAPNQFLIRAKGGVGIGTNSPAAQLDVNGTSRMAGFQLTTAPAAGFVLTSDASGTGTWQAAPGGAPAWNLAGNAGTTAGTNFVGTTDNQAVEIHANSERAFRVEPHADGPNVIGGYYLNVVDPGVGGATIAGGGSGTFDVSGALGPALQIVPSVNRVTDNWSTICGGLQNRAGNASGDVNDAALAFVGGGNGNNATAYLSTVVGGQQNEANGLNSFVGGGLLNQAWGAYSTIGGGRGNSADADYATVGGGFQNTAFRLGATVPGGYSNTANGNFSFAAGLRALALHHGAFVWGDSTNANITSTAPNQFIIRARGGVGIGTNSPAEQLDVNGTARMTGFQMTDSPAVGYVLTSDANGYGTWQSAAALKHTTVATTSGERRMHAEESAEVWFTDYGFGELRDGFARISLDPTFKETVDLDERYHVFVQAYGDADLYVMNRTSGGFEVRVRDGAPDVEFSYRVVAKRRGFGRERMPLAAKSN